ncbi:MAG: MFS transporter [Opitutaceae bacterium]|nr:MFS transporter [Opitutaceae bacterium]
MSPPPASLLPPRAWLVVALLWVVGCLNYLDRLMIITMRGSIKEAIPMSDAQFGLLTTVFLLAYAVLSPLGGFLADRFSRTRIIIFSLFAWSGTTWLTAHATTFSDLLVTRVLMGVSEACYLPAAGALIADYHRNATRSLANGIHLSGVMVGSGLGGVGGWIAEKYEWTLAFEIFGVGGILYAGLLILFLRDLPAAATERPPADGKESKVGMLEALRGLFSRSDFVIALLFWGLLGIASWSIIGWMPTYLTEHFHLPQGQAGLTTTLYIYMGSLTGMIVSGAWADRWSLTNVRGRVYVGLIGLGICVPAVMVIANTGLIAVLIVGLVVYGFTRAFPDANMMPILCQITDVRYRATGLGVLNAFATAVGGVTIYAGGVLRDAKMDIRTLFMCGAGGLLVCAVLLWCIKPRPTT